MTRPSTPLHLQGELTRVRVQLDYDSGELTFCNPVSMTPIYTFNDFFTEKMFPFFCPGANINGNNPNPQPSVSLCVNKHDTSTSH